MAKRKQYSEREKQAYYAGKAYATAKAGKRFPCKTEKGKASFRNGVNAVRGKKQSENKNGVKASYKRDVVDYAPMTFTYGITADGEVKKIY